jgi:hypothetical protein
MSSQSIVCASCSATVPYGRLSCPACGELLASVVGAARPAAAATPAVAERAPKRATRAARAAAAPSILVDVEPAQPDPEWPKSLPETPSARPIDAAGANGEVSDAPADLGAGGSFAAHSFQPAPVIAPPPAAPVPAYSSIATAPGAYVPPIPTIPAGPPAPARAWAGHAPDEGAGADAAEPSMSAGSLVDAARLPEFVGWLAVAGSAMAAVGFLLPWGISVIGASGVGYFDRWGLAGPFHPLIVLGLLAVLALALVRNPIPLWIRVGLAGFGLGALLLGLIWPYLLALRGTGPGVLVVTVGAMILTVAGVVALVTDRHATEDQAV